MIPKDDSNERPAIRETHTESEEKKNLLKGIFRFAT